MRTRRKLCHKHLLTTRTSVLSAHVPMFQDIDRPDPPRFGWKISKDVEWKILWRYPRSNGKRCCFFGSPRRQAQGSKVCKHNETLTQHLGADPRGGRDPQNKVSFWNETRQLAGGDTHRVDRRPSVCFPVGRVRMAKLSESFWSVWCVCVCVCVCVWGGSGPELFSSDVKFFFGFLECSAQTDGLGGVDLEDFVFRIFSTFQKFSRLCQKIFWTHHSEFHTFRQIQNLFMHGACTHEISSSSQCLWNTHALNSANLEAEFIFLGIMGPDPSGLAPCRSSLFLWPFTKKIHDQVAFASRGGHKEQHPRLKTKAGKIWSCNSTGCCCELCQKALRFTMWLVWSVLLVQGFFLPKNPAVGFLQSIVCRRIWVPHVRLKFPVKLEWIQIYFAKSTTSHIALVYVPVNREV